MKKLEKLTLTSLYGGECGGDYPNPTGYTKGYRSPNRHCPANITHETCDQNCDAGEEEPHIENK